jgi:RNA polymerase sigma-70 factor (ECF subfamily)
VQQRGLVDRARRGDHDAFASLAGAAIPRLDALARLILRDPVRGQDAVQEALVRAWRDLPSLRDPDRFDAWLRKLLVHACMDEARRHRRHALEVELTSIHHPTTRDSAVTVAERDALERGFRRLNAEQRALIVLPHYLDLSLPEVAETMRIPVGTAKSRLHRALSAMRASLEADARTSVELAGGRFA